VARQLRHLVESPRACSYLEEETAQLEHRVLVDVRPEELSHLLERGWRRFGPDYFRPACRACSACLPTRIPTATFAPSKSQRRAARKCASLVTAIAPPSVDGERLDLYAAWHATRERDRGWRESSINEETYRFQFAFAHPSAREITYRDPDDGRLVGVALSDEAPNAWSAIYFFYDPSWASRSIGVANVLFQIETARARGIAHLYLGYCVLACPSLAYKAAFNPQERLVGWPSLTEEPTWVVAADVGSQPR
jgi:arginyl-tRNA--protein-N-Asp/Glu arginylyltransferase